MNTLSREQLMDAAVATQAALFRVLDRPERRQRDNWRWKAWHQDVLRKHRDAVFALEQFDADRQHREQR